jgi:tetratricopeptide (TPR) repeat protein
MGMSMSQRARVSSLFYVVVAFAVVCAAALKGSAAENELPSIRLERIFRQAGARYKESPTNIEAAWQFARACFDLAELAKTDSERATLAEGGIAACRAAIARKYGSSPAHYYLAMNLGQLARTKAIGALKLVREMETEFKAAIELDEKFDYAGANRSLGLLYKDAPGWPTSIGSRNKARVHLRKAVGLSPEYPDNRLSLLEAYLEWGERRLALDELPVLNDVFESARKKFTGEAWELSWRDWESRFEKLKAKATAASERTVSPRGK